MSLHHLLDPVGETRHCLTPTGFFVNGGQLFRVDSMNQKYESNWKSQKEGSKISKHNVTWCNMYHLVYLDELLYTSWCTSPEFTPSSGFHLKGYYVDLFGRISHRKKKHCWTFPFVEVAMWHNIRIITVKHLKPRRKHGLTSLIHNPNLTIKQLEDLKYFLVGGFDPFEQYSSNWSHFAQIGVNIKIFETTTKILIGRLLDDRWSCGHWLPCIAFTFFTPVNWCVSSMASICFIGEHAQNKRYYWWKNSCITWDV